ncbi:MAG: hypothetical protein RDV48_00565 [Candidatus Eremiobacteraeota bacterium]|nr:hypothetical protein [Candidatus Eremiobacteraeota bacterium]
MMKFVKITKVEGDVVFEIDGLLILLVILAGLYMAFFRSPVMQLLIRNLQTYFLEIALATIASVIFVALMWRAGENSSENRDYEYY